MGVIILWIKKISTKTLWRVVWNQRLKMLRENTLRTVSRFRISLTETQEKVWQCGGGQEIDQSELGAIVGQTVKAKEYFNNNPRRSMTGGYDDVYKQVIRLLPTGKKHLKVLDVGCGIGNFVYRLEEQNYTNVTGVDFAETSLGIAKKRTPNYNLFLHDLTKPLPFKDDSLQNITCIDVLERGREHDKKLIVEISKKLQKTSKVILDFHSKERAKVNKKLDLGGCYSKDEIITILKQSFEITLIVGMGFAPTLNQFPQSLYPILNFLSKKLFPPARWVIIAQKL